MARPRKPTNVLELSGALARNPKRYQDRQHEPVLNDPLGPPPDRESFGPGARAVWMEIDRLAPWLVSADRLFVEIASQVLHEFRTVGVLRMPAAAIARLESVLSKLGFAATERSKIVDMTSGKRKSEYDDIS